MNDQYIIRKALPKDAFSIHEAHMRSIQELCSKDYSEAEDRQAYQVGKNILILEITKAAYQWKGKNPPELL